MLDEADDLSEVQVAINDFIDNVEMKIEERRSSFLFDRTYETLKKVKELKCSHLLYAAIRDARLLNLKSALANMKDF